MSFSEVFRKVYIGICGRERLVSKIEASRLSFKREISQRRAYAREVLVNIVYRRLPGHPHDFQVSS